MAKGAAGARAAAHRIPARSQSGFPARRSSRPLALRLGYPEGRARIRSRPTRFECLPALPSTVAGGLANRIPASPRSSVDNAAGSPTNAFPAGIKLAQAFRIRFGDTTMHGFAQQVLPLSIASEAPSPAGKKPNGTDSQSSSEHLLQLYRELPNEQKTLVRLKALIEAGGEQDGVSRRRAQSWLADFDKQDTRLDFAQYRFANSATQRAYQRQFGLRSGNFARRGG